MKFAKPFEEKLGLGVWHSCFDCSYDCGSGYMILSVGAKLDFKKENYHG